MTRRVDVPRIADLRHRFGRDDHDPAGGPALEIIVSDGKTVEVAGAGGGDVESRGITLLSTVGERR